MVNQTILAIIISIKKQKKTVIEDEPSRTRINRINGPLHSSLLQEQRENHTDKTESENIYVI